MRTALRVAAAVAFVLAIVGASLTALAVVGVLALLARLDGL